MRKYIFRGKRVDNGEWVYGDLLHGSWLKDGSFWIRYFDMHYHHDSKKIHPETVGQYTRFKDINGKDIYEGDIVEDALGYKYPIIFSERFGGFGVEDKESGEFSLMDYAVKVMRCKIIGNIYENPELLT